MLKITTSYIVIFVSLRMCTASATELILNVPGGSVKVTTENRKVTAIERNDKKLYKLSNSFVDHLKKSTELTLLNTYDDMHHPLFLVLTREQSRPNSMGRGYCGAGYEDFLLLVQLRKQTFTLTDHYLLQSCLYTKSLRIEQTGLDLQNAIHLNADGSYNFEMIDDDYGEMRNIKITQGRFIVKKVLTEPQ